MPSQQPDLNMEKELLIHGSYRFSLHFILLILDPHGVGLLILSSSSEPNLCTQYQAHTVLLKYQIFKDGS